jgi:hypothetical protein
MLRSARGNSPNRTGSDVPAPFKVCLPTQPIPIEDEPPPIGVPNAAGIDLGSASEERLNRSAKLDSHDHLEMMRLSVNLGSRSRYVPAGILMFVTSLTVSNGPLLFLGYGISAFGMLVTGLLLDPLPATLVFVVASVAAVSLIALSHSAFAHS